MPTADVISPAFVPSRELYPFTSNYYDGPHGTLHFVDEGEGIPLLMLHGNPTWSFMYRDVIKLLRGSFRCIAVDFPGFGLSARPPGFGYTPPEHAHAVGHLVDHLELDDMLVMGHDWGGPIGIAMALDRVDRTRGLIMGNTWCWPHTRLLNRAFARVMSTRLVQREVLERNLFVERMIPFGTARRLSRAEMDHYRRVQPNAAARLGVASFPYHLRAAAPWLADLDRRVMEHLRDHPLLLVWGMRDIAFSPGRFLDGWRRRFRDATVVELPGARHYICEDAPDGIARAILGRFGG